MTKQECAIVTAYTEISMLRGDDLKYLYRYLSDIIGRPVFSHEIPAVCEQFRDRIKADFIALCRNASDDIFETPAVSKSEAAPVRNGRWKKKNGEIYCTNCKKSRWSESFELLLHGFSFCPKCGARMDGGTDDAGHCDAVMEGGTISRERFAEIMGRTKRHERSD